MKSFTCTEEVLKITHVETGDFIEMHNGDVKALPDDMVEDLCARGWGTCDGVETGERKPGTVVLTPQNSKTLHGKPAAPAQPDPENG